MFDTIMSYLTIVTLKSTLIMGLLSISSYELNELPIVSFWKARQIEEKLTQKPFNIILIFFFIPWLEFAIHECMVNGVKRLCFFVIQASCDSFYSLFPCLYKVTQFQ